MYLSRVNVFEEHMKHLGGDIGKMNFFRFEWFASIIKPKVKIVSYSILLHIDKDEN